MPAVAAHGFGSLVENPHRILRIDGALQAESVFCPGCRSVQESGERYVPCVSGRFLNRRVVGIAERLRISEKQQLYAEGRRVRRLALEGDCPERAFVHLYKSALQRGRIAIEARNHP